MPTGPVLFAILSWFSLSQEFAHFGWLAAPSAGVLEQQNPLRTKTPQRPARLMQRDESAGKSIPVKQGAQGAGTGAMSPAQAKKQPSGHSVRGVTIEAFSPTSSPTSLLVSMMVGENEKRWVFTLDEGTKIEGTLS